MLSPQDVSAMKAARAEIWREKKKGWSEIFSIYDTPPTFALNDPTQPVAPPDIPILSGITGEKKPIPKSGSTGQGTIFGSMSQEKYTLKLLTEDTGEIEIKIGWKVQDETTKSCYRVEDAQKFEFYWILYLSEVI